MSKQDKISYKISADGRTVTTFVPTQPPITRDVQGFADPIKVKLASVGYAEKMNNVVAGRGPKGDNWVSWADCHTRLSRKDQAFAAGQWDIDSVPSGINWADFQQAMVVVLNAARDEEIDKALAEGGNTLTDVEKANVERLRHEKRWTVESVAQRMAGKPMAELLAFHSRPDVQGELARIAQERASEALARMDAEKAKATLASF